MKPFHFQQFTIQQNKDVFRVGTDGVLLGAICSVDHANNILEVGTGTGLISLMIAQRNPNAEILAIDIDENAVKLSGENFQNAPFSNRINISKQDFKTWETDEKFDLIVSNPPYFEENSSEKDVLARQRKELSFQELIQKSFEKLSQNGKLSVIIPFLDSENFEKVSKENKLFLQRKIVIYGIKSSNPKRVILEFGLNKKEIEEKEFTIEKSPRIYSDEYLELTKRFHIFKKH